MTDTSKAKLKLLRRTIPSSFYAWGFSLDPRVIVLKTLFVLNTNTRSIQMLMSIKEPTLAPNLTLLAQSAQFI